MTRYIVVNRPNPHLPHDSEELQSPPPPDALTDEIAQKNAELMIGKLLGKTPAVEGEGVLAPPLVQTQPCHAAPAQPDVAMREPRQAEPRVRAAARGPKAAAHEQPIAATRERAKTPEADGKDPDEVRLRAALLEGSVLGAEEDARDGLLARLRPVHGVALALLLATLLWPMMIGVAALLLIGSGVGITLMLRRAVAGGRWWRFASRHPRTAERLRRVADRAAVGVDRVLDLLPAGLADRLAWPDLSEPLSPGMG
ncbi:hypothetical protein [Roseovarius amoyensis]|uniref:hypothetical protein n=1 Tax=Roseovarius amoyensis TaxID=2211448 RepID=UPI000DBE3438|nr:hypothetical protein [Roseovarius amoyensis]